MLDRLFRGLTAYRGGLGRGAVLLAAALVLAACAAPLPPRPDIAYGEGLLWQVDKAGQASSYVFGTMHVPDPDVLDIPQAVEVAFNRSELAAFELVTKEEDTLKLAKRFAEEVVLPEDESLSELLGDVSYAQLLRIARRQRPRTIMIGKTHISRFKPWYVMLIIGKADASASHLDPTATTLDDYLEIRALHNGKKVVGLETFEEQLAVFNGLSLEDQAVLLKARLNDYNRWHNYRTAKEIYLSGDTALAYGIWQDNLRNVDVGVAFRTNDRFLDDRNRKMVERMQPLMAEGPTFVAIGALHLPGEEGILRLLEREGYSVTRLH